MVVCGHRPRNAEATRDAILRSATLRFAADSYDDVGLRDIAGDVGVDPALISRYFGSKEDLFVEVLDACYAGKDLTDGDRATFGQRIAEELVFGEKPEDKFRGMLITLRSIGSQKAMDVVQRSTNRRFIDPLAAWLGGDEPQVRARLLASLMMGATLSKTLSGGHSLTPAQSETMRDRMAVMLQAIVDS